MTFNRSMLTASWRSWYAYDMRRNGPQWLQWVWTFLFSMLMATGFTLLGFALYASGGGAWRHWTGWWHLYSINMVVALCIGYSIHGLFWLAVPLMGRERIGAVRGLNRLLLFAGVPLLGTAIGWPMAAWLVGQHGPGWMGLGDANTITGGMLVALLITAVLYQWFASKTRQAEAETRATEAQLRLLQGQIEPHFLFNTLAGVLALIDHDPGRARQMLQAFTDYLRASLTTLRLDEGPLKQELELARSYLLLLQSRMEDRLRFSIDVEPSLEHLPLPPLLLQPLVENAVQHGLEPTVEGGRVDIRARCLGGQLVIEVHDNGRGPRSPARTGQPAGSGVALANIRQRLLGRYGGQASLQIIDARPGTLARLTLPLQPALTTPPITP